MSYHFFLSFFLSLFIMGSQVFAGVEIERNGQDIFVRLSKINMTALQSDEGSPLLRSAALSSITVDGLRNTGVTGGPSLPQISFILVGRPKTLKVKVEVVDEVVAEQTVPSPSEETQVREGSYKTNTPLVESLYSTATPKIVKTYLGDFRGVHLTKVKINVATYFPKTKSVSVSKDFSVKHNSKEFRFKMRGFNKYLIIVPQGFRDALSDFVAWKESRGFIVEVEELHSDLISKKTVADIVKEYYKKRKVHFVMLVGTERMMPTNYVRTKFSYKTPSDYMYFTMGGATDLIPDIFHSRLVVETPQQLRRILWKSVRYELGLYSDTLGFQSIIGVASNEGKNPSDDEYVYSIGKTFKSGYGMLYTHLSQNSIHSNRVRFNKAMSRGAAWVTYMGHGNGTSWPSFNQKYFVQDIDRMKNENVVQPVVIDVSCKSGKFGKVNYLGSTMMSAGDGISTKGSVAYYGGSVNISWHPPAIMAKGIAIERFAQGFTYLGEGLLLGHLFLAKNWDRMNDFKDNLKWYHLQGDPGLKIRYDQRRTGMAQN